MLICSPVFLKYNKFHICTIAALWITKETCIFEMRTLKMAMLCQVVIFIVCVYYVMQWAVNSQSRPTSQIHNSCSRTTGTSLLHKWKQKQSQNESESQEGWFRRSLSRTIKSKCISCFDPHCNQHLCSANTFTANKAYWIILTVCGSGEERPKMTGRLVSGVREWKAEKRKWNWTM